ncbi:transposase [Inquilinus limosus]
MVDGLTGFPDAIGALFPQTTVQTPDRVGGRLCIVHLIRNSLAFVPWKDRRTVLPGIKAIYRAETFEAAAARLDEFEARWGARYPAGHPMWRRAWEHVVAMFAFPSAMRKMIYTTDEIDKRCGGRDAIFGYARATSWRGAAHRLQAPPSGLNGALPV